MAGRPDYVVEKLSSKHADPWKLVHKPAFDAQIETLRSQLYNLDDKEITLQLMRIVATFEDGHNKTASNGE